jgi:hypothetical protein
LLLCHQQLESRSRITDLVVGPDSLAYLAEPSAGRIDRFQILYDDARARGR